MIGHRVILASAGSGKTYRLANRILTLLLDGAAPESIVALTFTRKAAAEFVSRVLTTLAAAAAGEAEARRLAAALDRPELTRARCAERLGALVEAGHRLRFGTMDGFFQSLLRTHPLEFGLPGAFALLDERALESLRQNLLRRLLRNAADESTEGFLEAFRLASYGKDSRSAAANLAQFATDALELFRLTRGLEAWGDPGAIGPHETPSPEAFRALLDEARAGGAAFACPEKRFLGALAKFLDAAEKWRPGMELKPLESFLQKFLAPGFLSAADAGGAADFKYYREFTLPAPLTRTLAALARGVIALELDAKLRLARGAGGLIARYAALYEESVTDAGRLSFSDITDRLSKPEYADTLEQAAYRLDARVRHWLFDEFQDTSRRTWAVLERCVGDAMQDTAGERTVFFVGDMKQAVYGWNGGDHRLLPEIVAANRLPVESLSETRRCCPAVLEAVNAVFGSVDRTTLIPGAARPWADGWHDHVSGGPAAALPGFAAWRRVSRDTDGGADEADGAEPASAKSDPRLEAIKERLRAADFTGRGMTVGVLTRTNAEAARAAESLRADGIPCVCETDLNPAADNLITHALLALLRLAAHPGDTLALETVRMTPLAAVLDTRELPARALGRFTAAGAEAALRLLLEETRPLLPRDAFSAGRLDKLLEIGREYDETGERDPAAFPEFAAATKRRDKASPDRVQVMTIHKSKGLEFDCVFLPLGEGRTMEALPPRDFLAVCDPGAEEVRGVIGWPPALAADADPELARVREELKARQAYESLCLLYVALTRAKRELHLVGFAPKPEKPASGDVAPVSPDWTGLLASAFPTASGEGLSTLSGDPDWHKTHRPPAPPPPAEAAPALPDVAAVSVPRAVTPSDLKLGDFSPEPGFVSYGKEFGTEAHRLFEHLGAIAPDESSDALRARLADAAETAPDPGLARRAAAHVLEALGRPAFRAAMNTPDGARVFTELAYSRRTDDGSVESGTFDRVTLTPDGACLIQDFKTDACAPASLTVRYGDTLRAYRAAASALLGVPGARIALQLLHTPTGEVVPVA